MQAQGGIIKVVSSEAVSVEAGGAIDVAHEQEGGHVQINGDRIVVHNDASIVADGSVQGGHIDLNADSFISLGGQISANGDQGGRIAVTSGGVLSLAGNVSAEGRVGKGGEVIYRAYGRLLESSSGFTSVIGEDQRGYISGYAAEDWISSGQYLAYGNKGGIIDISAGHDLRLLAAQLDAHGQDAGGVIQVGGPLQGGKQPSSQKVFGRSNILACCQKQHRPNRFFSMMA